MRKYNYECNREKVTISLPYHIINLKGFKAFVMNISPAPRNDSESDYSRVEITINTLEGRREPIVCILKGQLQRFDKLSVFDRFRHVENGFDINF